MRLVERGYECAVTGRLSGGLGFVGVCVVDWVGIHHRVWGKRLSSASKSPRGVVPMEAGLPWKWVTDPDLSVGLKLPWA